MRPLLLFLLACLSFSCSDSSQKNAASSSAATSQPTTSSEVSQEDSSTATSPADSAFLIVPGQQIGQIHLGDSPDEVHAALGDSDEGNAAMGKSISTWYSKGSGQDRHRVDVYTVRENTGTPGETVGVKQIRVTSPSFKVAGTQLSAGSLLQDIRKAFPAVRATAYYQSAGKRVYFYDAAAQGISFEVSGPDSSCTGIAIHAEGQNMASTYLPLYPGFKTLSQK